jgi:hypothetical protein
MLLTTPFLVISVRSRGGAAKRAGRKLDKIVTNFRFLALPSLPWIKMLWFIISEWITGQIDDCSSRTIRDFTYLSVFID